YKTSQPLYASRDLSGRYLAPELNRNPHRQGSRPGFHIRFNADHLILNRYVQHVEFCRTQVYRALKENKTEIDSTCDAGRTCCAQLVQDLSTEAGYERAKRILWTNSMASRGKMMGKASFGTIEDNAHGHASIAVTELYTRSPSVSHLVEPGLQDIPRSCRDYIRYCESLREYSYVHRLMILPVHQELSKECVVYNNSSFNPFLSLMPLMPSSQALSHIMISISAFHIAHRLDISHAQLQPDHSEVVHIALLNKQKALRCLKQELRVQPEINTDAVIAAVLLFVNLDWVIQTSGYSISILLVRRKSPTANEESRRTDSFRFDILGSTLVPSHSLRVAPVPLDTGLLDTLRRSEQQTWIGCPADLLSLLHVMNTLRAVSGHSSHADETITSILDSLGNFSPQSWAHDFPDPQHHESRHHLAHAYKAAVSVYAYHIITETLGQPPFPELDVSRITDLGIFHMSQIPASNFHIKSLVWPAFVLGAEARDLHIRNKVSKILRDIWISSCCYNVKTASNILGLIWEQGEINISNMSWLRYIWTRNKYYLFL
ncbi:hypothetical protein LB506_010103, partial [Fusarium annulatum]